MNKNCNTNISCVTQRKSYLQARKKQYPTIPPNYVHNLQMVHYSRHFYGVKTIFIVHYLND